MAYRSKTRKESGSTALGFLELLVRSLLALLTWIFPNTHKVVAMGQGLEAMTGGVCVATTHRVLSPVAGKCSTRPNDPYHS